VTVTAAGDKNHEVKSADITVNIIETPEPEPEPEPERPGIDFFLLRRDCELPATGFSSLRPTVLPEQPKDLRYEPVRMHLMLPMLDRDVELVTMPREGNSWAAAWLGSDAGILEGSALPGEGVSVIAGHNTLNDTDYGPFALLAALDIGDVLYVRRSDGELLRFTVYLNEKIGAGDADALQKSALVYENTLTLLTCEDALPEGGYASRRIVSAKYND
jgi:LPXTG-site transpeptidase (sortase) family protein